MAANPITPERATAVYRAYIARPDIDTRTLCDMPTEQLLELAAAESEPVVTVAESDPLAWLDEAEAWQADHPGELYADRNGPPIADEYRDPPQEAPEPDEQPEPTPPTLPLASQPENDDWLLY